MPPPTRPQSPCPQQPPSTCCRPPPQPGTSTRQEPIRAGPPCWRSAAVSGHSPPGLCQAAAHAGQPPSAGIRVAAYKLQANRCRRRARDAAHAACHGHASGSALHACCPGRRAGGSTAARPHVRAGARALLMRGPQAAGLRVRLTCCPHAGRLLRRAPRPMPQHQSPATATYCRQGTRVPPRRSSRGRAARRRLCRGPAAARQLHAGACIRAGRPRPFSPGTLTNPRNIPQQLLPPPSHGHRCCC
jgi:hypothetical protein